MPSPTTATIKRLFAVSGNRCAFPGCSASLVIDDTVTGEICHIKAQNAGGPRYDPDQSDDERHGFDNLLLLCGDHHKVIDADPETYTIERLHKIKDEHEGRQVEGVELSDRVARQLAVAGGSVVQVGDVSGGTVSVHVGDVIQQPPVAPPSLHQLPAPPADFTGREEELAQLAESIAEGGVTISGLRGMGGVGKTALALKLAERLAGDYPDVQIFLDLKGTDPDPLTPVQAMGYVVHAFHPRLQLPASGAELAALYRSLFHSKRALLLLDDAAGADQVQPLVPPASCALLVTSRQHFRLPGMKGLDLDALPLEDAVAFLLKIDGRISGCAGEIARLCGCLPLALELAGRALAEYVDLSPADYLERLRDRRTRLGLVEASIDLSYDLLEEALQRRWCRLAVFANPFERGAAAAVWEMGDGPTGDVLGELVRCSLVGWDGEAARYRMHALLRDFAYERLQEAEDVRSVHRLAAEYLQAEITDETRVSTLMEALEEVDQWERAEEWEAFARRASALVGSLDWRGYWGEIGERLERALSAVREHQETPLGLESTLLGDLRKIAHRRAWWVVTAGSSQKELEIWEGGGDPERVAIAWGNLGSVYADKGEWEQAIEIYEQSLEAFERAGDVYGVAQTYNNLGSVYFWKGEWERAIEMYEQSLEIKERLGVMYSKAETWGNLGTLYLRTNRPGEAKPLLARACLIFALFDSSSSVQAAAQALVQACGSQDTADAYLAQVAYEMCEQSLETKECSGDAHVMAHTYKSLGRLYVNKGEWDRAIEMYEQSLEALGRLGNLHGMAQMWTNIAWVYLQADRPDEAKPLLVRAHLVFTQVGSPHTQTAAELLVQACGGSQEAADAYLAQEMQRDQA